MLKALLIKLHSQFIRGYVALCCEHAAKNCCQHEGWQRPKSFQSLQTKVLVNSKITLSIYLNVHGGPGT